MKKTMIVGAIGALLWAAAGAQAQGPAEAGGVLPTSGTREIGLAGNYQFNGAKPYFLSASYGIFTSPTIEIGAQGSVAGASGSKTATSIGGFADYYFTGLGGGTAEYSAVAPYLGAFIGYSHLVDNTTSYGGQAGVKFFFNPNVALDAGYQYRTARHSNGQSQLFLGLSTFFR